jgi:hypothetical protein
MTTFLVTPRITLLCTCSRPAQISRRADSASTAHIEHPLAIEEGMAIAPARHGHGITFDWSGLAQVAS